MGHEPVFDPHMTKVTQMSSSVSWLAAVSFFWHSVILIMRFVLREADADVDF